MLEQDGFHSGPGSPPGPRKKIEEFAHRLGNPLHVIAGRARLLHKRLSGDEYAIRNLDIIISQAERMFDIINDMIGAGEKGEQGKPSGKGDSREAE